MQIATIVCFGMLVVLTLGQLIAALAFIRVSWRRTPPLITDAECPSVGVVLCLRGPDPFLESTIEALLAQDYPDFQVHIVVDHERDPANEVVSTIIERHTPENVHVEILRDPKDCCGLKCSSLTQVIPGFDNSYQVVVFLDADTVPHPAWLRQLVAPLSEQKLGAVAGNRWYMPSVTNWGSLVRYLWNSSAVPQMYLNRFTWGGSLAIRAEVFSETDMLDRWGRALCEDTMISRILARHGYRVGFVPELLMVNRETCTLSGFLPWMRRQVLNGKLYHPAWPAIAGYSFFMFAALIFSLVMVAIALATQQWQHVWWLVGALVVFQVSNVALLGLLEYSIRRIVSARGEDTAWLGIGGLIRLLPALILTQIVYAGALLSLFGLRKIDWRGVSYEIRDPFDVRLIEYRPYGASTMVGQEDDSL